MALNLNLSGTESTDFKTITLTDTTDNWDAGSNINYNEVMYAEIYVGIRGALYGPLVLTDVFTSATTQNDLVFVITPRDLGIDSDTFDDALQSYHYGVTDEANPTLVGENVWNGEDSYTLPVGSSENKIPFTIQGETARQYQLMLTINLSTDDQGVNPMIRLNVNYTDGTATTVTQAVPQDGASHTYTLTANVDLTREVTYVTGFLLDEDRQNTAGRQGTITSISLRRTDFDLESTVKRGLVAERSKRAVQRDLVALAERILCGRESFEDHERAIIRDVALRSATNGATQGLANNVEGIIDFLNDDM